MPTRPPKELYDPDLIVEGTRAIRQRFEPALREVICYGAHWVDRVLKEKPKPVTAATLPCVSLQYQVLEALDASLVLLRQACAIGMRQHLRTAFEGSLSLEYILEEDTERRGAAYFVADVHIRLDWYDVHDAGSTQGQRFQERCARDRYLKGIGGDRMEGLVEERKRLESAFEGDAMKEASEEYMRAKGNKSSQPKWYSLFKGPRNLRELADRLKAPGMYDILYREWSATAHAQDMRRHMLNTGDGNLALVGLRDGRQINTAGTFALLFGVEATRTFLLGLWPEVVRSGEFASWYATEVRAALIGA